MRHRLAVCLLCFLLVASAFSPFALAEGSGNIDSGNGGMSSGSSQNYWNNEDGVRITVLHNGAQTFIMDWSNKSETSVVASFVRKSKLSYLSGASRAPSTSSYSSTVLSSNKLPTIVGGAGGNSIAAIRLYFTDEVVIRKIALQSGIPYDDLIGGEYKLLLEPIAYFTFQGIKYAITATEAAKFDMLVDNQLYACMKSLTHQNLPLSMFLQNTDTELGLYKWTGSTSGKQTDANIITYLGMGIVSFTAPTTPTVPSAYDYEFHTDTDVIVSFHLTNNTGSDITPDGSAYVTLNIAGAHYNRQFVCPAGETQLVWVRWHTPDTPQIVAMTATSSEIPSLDATLTANVTELVENTPPDPTYYDRDDSFHLAATPDYGNNNETTWGEWYSYWHPNLVTYTDEHGNP